MLEIEKFKNGHNYDVFIINTDTGSFEISFQGNLDLYWRYLHNGCILDSKDKVEIIITKENYYIYSLFYKLYENIKNSKVYYGDKCFKVKNNHLFKNGKIEWYSDELYDEIASKLTIQKEEESFRVTFEKSKEWHDGIPITYAIRFRNSGSKYDPFNTNFMQMYNQLKEYDIDNHQIHIEEILYKQKMLKKCK